MDLSGKTFSTAYQIKMKISSFPATNPATGKKWKNAELFQKCEELTLEVFENENSESLKDWSDILNAANSKTLHGMRIHKKETRLAWKDLKSVYSVLSFQIDHAKKFLTSVNLPNLKLN